MGCRKKPRFDTNGADDLVFARDPKKPELADFLVTLERPVLHKVIDEMFNNCGNFDVIRTWTAFPIRAPA